MVEKNMKKTLFLLVQANVEYKREEDYYLAQIVVHETPHSIVLKRRCLAGQKIGS